MKVRMAAGRTVQMISITWESRMYVLVSLVDAIATII